MQFFFKSISYVVIVFFFYGSSLCFSATNKIEIDEDLRRVLINAINDTDSFADRFEAEVWLMDMSQRLKRRIKDPKKRLDLLKLVHYEAQRVDLPPELILAVIDIESNFDRWALSYVGARGYMQVMPFWLKEMNRPDDDLFTPEINVRMGCTILRFYVDKEKGDLTRGLARYNGSLGRTKYPNKVFLALRKRWYRR
ncbi:FIG016425: Soluble lytic murein transglycosylase and related regulatory proteins (some contain LysM/invasin domains) [hydrothermal vent metagenome]|uniref:FIG016425: Soluble lytic murein transglycosylase and related regulatory proteins (Some contain LysM/invasin domains) n=1 Tax=hydrothermal vent metagenome TaxID=652676 RepID=A0A3B0Z537_9ZZZZ